MAIVIASGVARHFFGTDTTTVTPTIEPPKQQQVVPAGQPGADAWVIKACDVHGRPYWDGPARPDRATCLADLKQEQEAFAYFADDLKVEPGYHCPTPRDECIKVTLDDQGHLPRLNGYPGVKPVGGHVDE
jgi:hypothetical protein